MRIRPCAAILFAVCCVASQIGCSGGKLDAPVATIQVSPASRTVRVTEVAQFSATVSGADSGNIIWSVNGVPGGNSVLGTVSADGTYSAPKVLPENNMVMVRAQISGQTMTESEATVTLWNPVPTVGSVSETPTATATVLSISGTSFVPGATAMVDGTAVPTQFVSPTSLLATADASAASRQVEVSIMNPEPGSANSQNYIVAARPSRPSRSSYSVGAARFLDQASFGPLASGADVAAVQSMGVSAYIDDQMNLGTHPQSSWVIPSVVPTNPANGNQLCQGGNLVTCFQILWFQNALMGNDQLRQRTAFALSQIWVVSGNTDQFGDSYSTYYKILNTDAFANYQTIINDVTLTSAMGFYLDMGNSAKPANGELANENYARELMQLFTVGLYLLNDDGTYKLDVNGQPIPTYSETDIEQIAKALTGWTYARNDQQVIFNQSYSSNNTNRSAPMVAVALQHDTTAKVCDTIGCNIPSGQTAAADLTSVTTLLFNHPNVPAFVSKQMIEHLVTSNPSPAYVARISAIFRDDSSVNHVRGNMAAVVKAILLDQEARVNDQYVSNDDGGHLREPVLYLTAIVRGLASSINPANATTYTTPSSGNMTNLGATLVGSASNMGQNVLFSPSVFNYFPPDNIIPETSEYGPEFLLFTTATSPLRANFADSVIRNSIGTGIDFSATISTYAGTPAAPVAPDVMVDRLDKQFTYGQMSTTTKAAIVSAISTMANANQNDLNFRAKRAIYLVLTSSRYQVIH